MLLFFDVETSGLPDFNKRASDPTQPHIVQLAALLTDNDGAAVETYNKIIRPDGWIIPEDVIAVHGITNEKARAIGVPEGDAARVILRMINSASVVCAHNCQFDKFIARIALRRFGLLEDAQDAWWKALPTFCTMRATTDICKLPGKFAGKYKWPKLQEAYQHAFQRSFDGAHDALADVTACKDIYFWLQKGGVA